MNLDVPGLLVELAARRPIFHSEADFQHALAALLHDRYPKAQIRLEYPPAPESSEAINILFRHRSEAIALELKYLKEELDCESNGERFVLKKGGARDLRLYDCMKDVARCERFAASAPTSAAAVIVLTNDSAYWRMPNSGENPAYKDFSLREGRVATGSLAWGRGLSPNTIKSRENRIDLKGAYTMRWRPYSHIDSDLKNSAFRYLHLPVGKV